jgi:hypothetical protein
MLTYTQVESIIARVTKRLDVYVLVCTSNGPVPAQMAINHGIL